MVRVEAGGVAPTDRACPATRACRICSRELVPASRAERGSTDCSRTRVDGSPRAPMSDAKPPGGAPGRRGRSLRRLFLAQQDDTSRDERADAESLRAVVGAASGPEAPCERRMEVRTAAEPGSVGALRIELLRRIRSQCWRLGRRPLTTSSARTRGSAHRRCPTFSPPSADRPLQDRLGACCGRRQRARRPCPMRNVRDAGRRGLRETSRRTGDGRWSRWVRGPCIPDVAIGDWQRVLCDELYRHVVLGQAGIPPSHAGLSRALAWLRSHQDPTTGASPAVSHEQAPACRLHGSAVERTP